MAEEKIVFKVVVDDKGNVVKLQSTEKGFNDIDLTVKNAEKSAQKLNQTIGKTGSGATLKGVKLTAKEYNKLAKTQNQLKDATGSATSATMELSRVVSDAPYGIRGMANNITQLVSQLGTASTKAGGFGKALRLMGSQLLGPLGVVFAITAVVSALDFFFGANQKSKKAVSDLTKEVYSSGLVANQYVKELEDVNLTEKRRKVVTQELIKLVPTLKKEDLKYGKNLDNVKLKIKQYTLAQASRIEMDKLVEQNSALLSKQMKVDLVNSTEDQEEKVRIIKGLLKEEGIELEKAVNKSYQMGQSNLTLRKKTNTELIQDFKDLAKGIEKESKPILEKINNLSQGLSLNPSKTTEDSDKNDKVKGFTVFPPKTIENQVKFAKKIIKTVAESMGVEIGKNPVQLDKLIDTELSDETKEKIKIYNEKLKAEMALSDQLLGAENFISKSQDILGGMTNFMNAQFEREMTIESNKTSALNEELNNRLLNENLSKDERVKIQNQIAINDEKLRKKQEKIAKKQFDMNKASNIASALMDTSAAAIGVMKDAKGGFFARLSQALPTIAFGLAQVATISRQKFQSSSANTPINTTGGGGGAGATERADPSFNIVGGSRENQLLTAIQSQFDKPLKAYVVSTEVTDQQQLDSVIVNTAGT
jgi:hypothetical protein